MQLTSCPECGAPAEEVDSFVLSSTDGPVRHVRVHCVQRHWFLMTDSWQDEQAQVSDASTESPSTRDMRRAS